MRTARFCSSGGIGYGGGLHYPHALTTLTCEKVHMR